MLQKLFQAVSFSFSRLILACMGESSCSASRMWLSHKISKVAEKQQLIIQLHQTYYISLSFQYRPLRAYFLHNSVALCPKFLLFSVQHSPIMLLLETNADIKYFKYIVLEIGSATLSLRPPVSQQ